MILARADITSKDEAKKQRFLANFDLVEEKIAVIKEKRPPADTKIPRRRLRSDAHIRPAARPAGRLLHKNLQNAIRECDIDDTREAAIDYLYELGRRAGINPSIHHTTNNNVLRKQTT